MSAREAARNGSGRVVGLTADAGYQIGVRRTLPIGRDRAWDFLLSPEGRRLWLGDVTDLQLQAGAVYRSVEGIAGEFRVVKPKEQLRLTWQPKGWEKPSTLQIRLLSSRPDKTTLSFHQEKLSDAAARERMKERWEEALAVIAERTTGEG
ncbi:hypothetical protein J19TS2_35880 [Cohnella xylanilytica]|uniref:SRPBCC family protein n=1 Tax=Cohnella xylanilytica TaxID=557555 RepID=UPI001B075CD3|nr:SRPBCC domain-containing protein [Cohnella xylanilytica]GIO14033.1 hypothetical protein J19TS2_35880 [Cohnella xylanilytica]